METKNVDPAAICARYGLICLDDLSHRGSTSDLVLRVQDAQGVEYAFKHMGPEVRESEVQALRTWTASGVTPRLIKELEPGYYLVEWLQGRTMAEVPHHEPVPAVDVGRALATLHRVPPPDGAPEIQFHFALESEPGWKLLPPSLSLLATRLTKNLDHESGQSVFLHGDLVPANVMLTPVGPRFIDPVGRRGHPARDLAQLAASGVGRGSRNLLAPLLKGYGRVPPLLADAFAWMILFYLQKNLAVPNSPFTQHLLPVAAALDHVGDAERFTECYLRSVCN